MKQIVHLYNIRKFLIRLYAAHQLKFLTSIYQLVHNNYNIKDKML